MAARALVKKIIGNPKVLSVSGVSRSPGIDRRNTTCFVSSGIVGPITKDRGYVELWNNKPEVEQQRLLPRFASSCGIATTTNDRGVELSNNKVEVLQPQEADGLTSSLLSIQHHRGTGGGEGILKITTSSLQSSPPRESISVRRIALQRPGPFDLPRQEVEGVVCITTKDAFLLYNPTTGVTSPWIETTIAREGEAKRKVVSIALGYDPKSGIHKVICISRYVTAPETTEVGTLVAEVLNVRDRTWTTGEHKWRKLKALTTRFTFPDDGPVYLDGKIHWQCYTKFHYVLEFDVKRETFVCTPFPKRLGEELRDSSPQSRSMLKLMALKLMVVDGKLAILRSTSGQKTSTLYVCYVKGGKIGWQEIEWTDEKVFTPYAYVVPMYAQNLPWKLLQGHISLSQTQIVPATIFRKMKVSLRIPTLPISGLFDRGRITQL